jgi:hypothetical protein
MSNGLTNEVLAATVANNTKKYDAIQATLQLPTTYTVGVNDKSYFNCYLGFNNIEQIGGRKVADQIESGVSYTTSLPKLGWRNFLNLDALNDKPNVFDGGPADACPAGSRFHLKLLFSNHGKVELYVDGRLTKSMQIPGAGTSRLAGVPKIVIGVQSTGNSKNAPSVRFDRMAFVNVQVREAGKTNYEPFVGVEKLWEGHPRSPQFKVLQVSPPMASYGT